MSRRIRDTGAGIREQLSAIGYIDIENAESNGDFINDTVGFTVVGSVAVDEVVYLTSGKSIKLTATGTTVYALKDYILDNDHIIYIAIKGLITSTSNNFGIRVYDYQSSSNIQDILFDLGILGSWQLLSATRTIAGGGIRLYIGVNASRTFVCNYDNLIIVDLTDTFGAGNEPSKEEMDYLLEEWTSEYLDGTESVDWNTWLKIKIKYLQDQISAL